jgi:CheY-like chemotaxis protein
MHMPMMKWIGCGDPPCATQDGYFDFVYAPTCDDAGAVSGVFVFAVDVTQQVLARRALEVALADAQSAARAKDEFLALLGHELRNPLAPILTAVELMHVRGFVNVERECAVIERQTQHLVRLVDDLLDVARIVRGKIELDRKRVALIDVIARSAELASPLIEQRRHRLAIDVPRDLLLDVDVGRMAQVFANLLTNAAKYTEPGGHITVAARRDGDEIITTVTDDGIGMSSEMLPTIFEMFVQERQALDRARGGLGLGLTIVRSLVALHGGTVGVRSSGRGHGSEFEVRLPGTVALPAPDAVATSSRVRLARTARRVLIVDDNEDAAHMLSDAVAALGHTTEVAHDGPSALEIVEAFQPDVALLDIGLPVMDGYELGRKLRSLTSLPRMRIVAVTGYGQASDQDRSHAAGFDAHLVKPVQLSRLVSLLDALLPADPPDASSQG